MSEISSHREQNARGLKTVSIEALTPAELSALVMVQPDLVQWLLDWINRLAELQPVCLACDTVFTEAKLPAMWLLAQVGAEGALFMGACADCCELYPTDVALINRAAAAMGGLRPLGPVMHNQQGRA